jgi:hypothetical protein
MLLSTSFRRVFIGGVKIQTNKNTKKFDIEMFAKKSERLYYSKSMQINTTVLISKSQ